MVIKIKIVENKYINALLLLMLLSAIVHMLILFVFAIISKNLHILNYFSILNVNYFLPNFLNSVQGDIISFIFTLIMYLVILKINKIQ